jgi:hypothetical protein
MKTLRLLRNVAALFILGTAMYISRPGAAYASTIGSCHWTCVSSLGTHCKKSASGCTTVTCQNGNCANSACLLVCIF